MEDFIKENEVKLAKEVTQQLPVLRKLLVEKGIQYLCEAVFHAIDKTNELPELKNNISCGSGCSFCCHEKVKMTSFEASFLVSYIDHHKIPINKERLRKQFKTDFMDLSFADKTCALLDDKGLCSVYEIRPVICRLYNSQSDPKFCDFDTYPEPTKTIRVLEAYALYMALMKLDRETESEPIRLIDALDFVQKKGS